MFHHDPARVRLAASHAVPTDFRRGRLPVADHSGLAGPLHQSAGTMRLAHRSGAIRQGMAAWFQIGRTVAQLQRPVYGTPWHSSTRTRCLTKPYASSSIPGTSHLWRLLRHWYRRSQTPSSAPPADFASRGAIGELDNRLEAGLRWTPRIAARVQIDLARSDLASAWRAAQTRDANQVDVATCVHLWNPSRTVSWQSC